MKEDPVQAAVDRSAAAMAVLEKHKGACEPHFAMLCQTFGPDIFRSIIAGAVEAAVIAHRRQAGSVIVPFPEERT